MNNINVCYGFDKDKLTVLCTSHNVAQTHILYSKTYNQMVFKQNRFIDINSVSLIIKETLREIKEIIGYKPTNISVSLYTKTLQIKKSNATIRVVNNMNIITNSDVNNVKELARNILIDTDDVVIDTKTFRYVLDEGKKVYGSPVGYQTSKLTVDMMIYLVNNSLAQSIYDVFLALGVTVSKIYPSSMGLGYESSTENSLESGCVIANIGLKTTEISYFTKKTLVAVKTVKTGYYKIIKDLMIFLNVDREVATTYFEKIGSSLSKTNNTYTVYSKYNKKLDKMITYTNKDIIRVATLRIEDMFMKMSEAVKEISGENEPIVVTGYLSNLRGVNSIVRKVTNSSNSRIYTPNYIGASKPEFTAPLGVSYLSFINKVHKPRVNSTQNVAIPSIEERGFLGLFKRKARY